MLNQVEDEGVQSLNPPAVYDPSALGMSQGVLDRRSGYLFVSGQVAWGVDGQVRGTTVAEQTPIALDNLTAVLRAGGCTAADVISVRVYVRGELADHMPACAPALAAYFAAARPALTGVGVASLATRDTLIEIEVVARAPSAA